ncbi:hypothetical protein CDV55_105659 [Aspergillus turcosus]|nr:hypothetical protein CDV55_105659 [Aspergillus turcosus]
MIVEPEPPIDFYSSPYLAEHYDLICEAEQDYYRDVDTFWKLLQQQMLASRPSTEPIYVVDVGTGTGRVLNSLGDRARSSQFDLSKVDFVGTDPSQYMLDRAAQCCSLSHVGRVSWRCGSATSLLETLPSREGAVDLLIFADGGIAHLIQPGHGERFFASVADLLRPRTGRACIAVTNFEEAAKSLKYNDDSGTPQERASKQFANVIYRNAYLGTSVTGSRTETKYHFEVIRRLPGAEDEVITAHQTVLKGKIWTEEELVSLIEGSGLFLVEIDARDPLQTFYHLARKDSSVIFRE